MFPAIRSAIKEFRQGFGSEPVLLDLEQKSGGVGPEWYARNGFNQLYALHSGGGPSWSGETVNEAVATNLSTVWACRRIISEAVAFIPLDMMQKTRAGKFPADGVDAPVHPMHAALKYCPNEEMSSMVFREAGTGNLLMSGNEYAQIYRRSGTGVAYELEPLEPKQVKLDRDSQKRRVYIVDPNLPGSRTYTVERGKPHDVLHVIGPSTTGREGQGIITQARQSIGASISADRYAARHFARGGRQSGYIKVERPFGKKEDEDKFVEDLDKATSGPDGYHKWPVFPPGVTFQPSGWSPIDSQFLETREFNVPEICRWFLLSPDLVGDMSKATLNNIEQLTLRLVKMTLTAWLVRWEQDLWRCLLTPAEKLQGYYFHHNVNGLLRGDFATRMSGYATMLQNGPYNIDEVRDLEDLNALPNGAGKAHHIQLNMATVPGTGAPMVAEQGILDRMAQSKKPAA
jgi:HK97 family phage portal protein